MWESSLELQAKSALEKAAKYGDKEKKDIAKDILKSPELFRDFCLLVMNNSNKKSKRG